MNKAFTLIELLVVVLIIGILSAIALPQYQKAVTKARFAEAFTNLKTLADAVKVCELQNGQAGDDNDICKKFSNLDIEIGEVDPHSNDQQTYTSNFIYAVERGGLANGAVAEAFYRKADACLCIYDDGTFSAGLGDDCFDPALDYDIAKLLGVEDGCSCC